MQPTGPTIDWELWEGFLQGMGVWSGLLLPGLRLQHPWGSKEGRGQGKRQELGQTPLPRAPMPPSFRLTLRNSYAQEKRDSSRGTAHLCTHVPRPPFRGIWSPQGRRLQGGNLTLQSRNLETQRSDPAHARVHSRSGTTERLEEGFPELGMLAPWP